MIIFLEGLGIDNVFSLYEDNYYWISKSLVKFVEGSIVFLIRVKCLVFMIILYDIRFYGLLVILVFVEFDILFEGFGCLFLFSLVFYNVFIVNIVMIGFIDGVVVSGIGFGERFFFFFFGLSYFSWFCIEYFSFFLNNYFVRFFIVVC